MPEDFSLDELAQPNYSGVPQVNPQQEQTMYMEMLKQVKAKEQAKSKAKVKTIDAQIAKINADNAQDDMLTELAGGEMTSAVTGSHEILTDFSNGLHPTYDSRY